MGTFTSFPFIAFPKIIGWVAGLSASEPYVNSMQMECTKSVLKCQEKNARLNIWTIGRMKQKEKS